MLRRLAILTLLAVLGCSSGCAYFKPNHRLISKAQEEQVDTDLPVPQGFELDPSRSYRHQRSTYRRFQLVYRAEEYLGEDRVRDFLRDFFPRAGWETAFVYGLETSKFVFFKGPEECRVEVSEDFGDRFTEISIVVEPRKTPDGELVAREPESLPAGATAGADEESVDASISK